MLSTTLAFKLDNDNLETVEYYQITIPMTTAEELTLLKDILDEDIIFYTVLNKNGAYVTISLDHPHYSLERVRGMVRDYREILATREHYPAQWYRDIFNAKDIPFVIKADKTVTPYGAVEVLCKRNSFHICVNGYTVKDFSLRADVFDYLYEHCMKRTGV